LQGREGIPKLYAVSTEGGYHGMVMELLGPSIESLLASCGGHFSMATVLEIAEQMINRVETFHNKGLLHRDIKPDNFTVGRGDNASICYIIDYGLCKRYRNSRTKAHIPFKTNKKLTGTARYSSVNTHMGIEQSRRDDMECLGYTFIYLARGELPWQGIKAENKKEKYDKIMERKNDVPIESLCKGLPMDFVTYMYYVKNLQFEDKPDYNQLKKLFRDCWFKNHFDKGFIHDWIKLGIDLKNYKKPEVTLGEKRNDSNKAECENNAEDQIQRARSKEVNKTNLDNKHEPQMEKAPASNDNLLKMSDLVKPDKINSGRNVLSPGFEIALPAATPSPDISEASPANIQHNENEESKFPNIKVNNTEFRDKNKRAAEIKKLSENMPPENGFPKQIEEAKEKNNKLDYLKGIPVQIFRQITKELSENSSCNFKISDILENCALLGIFYIIVKL